MSYLPHEYVRPPAPYSTRCVECGLSASNPLHNEVEEDESEEENEDFDSSPHTSTIPHPSN